MNAHPTRLVNGGEVLDFGRSGHRLEVRRGLSIHFGPVVFSTRWVYNLSRTVNILRLPTNDGQRRWLPQSPAIKAGLTDRLGSIRELLTHIPVLTHSV